MGEGGAGTGPEYDTLYSANMQMLELLLRGGPRFALSLEMVAVALKQKNPLTPLAGPPLIVDQFSDLPRRDGYKNGQKNRIFFK